MRTILTMTAVGVTLLGVSIARAQERPAPGVYVPILGLHIEAPREEWWDRDRERRLEEERKREEERRREEEWRERHERG